jgi:hypothetical protein
VTARRHLGDDRPDRKAQPIAYIASAEALRTRGPVMEGTGPTAPFVECLSSCARKGRRRSRVNTAPAPPPGPSCSVT